MKSLNLLLSLVLASASVARGDSAAFDAKLADEGSKLLRGDARADDVIAYAAKLRATRPLSEDEKLFLVDLGDKLEPRDRDRLCPSLTSGLCEKAATDLPVAFAEDPLPPLEAENPRWSSSGWAWLVAAVVIGAAGASAMKGKELVIHRP